MSREEQSSLDHLRSVKFWKSHYRKIWILGVVLRILASTWTHNSYDYNNFRLPIAKAILDGKGLYNEIIYNQMPLYPYLTAVLLFFVGTRSDVLTAMVLVLPIALVDYLSCYLLHEIGKLRQKEHIGLISSLVYALNPVAMHVITQSNWDVVASMFVLLSYYLLLRRKAYWTGIAIALGFLTKEFPLFFFGFLLIHWWDDLLLVAKSSLSFGLTTLVGLASVLLPYQADLIDLRDSLLSHPIIQNESSSPVSRIYDLINSVVSTDYQHFQLGWAVLFFGYYVITLLVMLYLRTSDVREDILTLQLTLISLLFLSIHSQFVLWVLPWLIWTSVERREYIPFLILTIIGYFLRRIELALFGDLLLLTVALTILVTLLYTIYKSSKPSQLY